MGSGPQHRVAIYLTFIDVVDMRRLSIACLTPFARAIHMPLVIDVQYGRRTSEEPCAVPVQELARPSVQLLQDLTFDDLGKVFSPRVHQVADEKATPQFHLSATNRALALMPVTTERGEAKETKWVPFLILGASPFTFFTKATIEALELNQAHHVSIMSRRVLWQKSAGQLGDLNVLGTDFLRHGHLSIKYPTSTVHFELVPDTVTSYWYATDGGTTIPVWPEYPYVAHLKEAIKAKIAPNDAAVLAPRMIIRDPDGNIQHDEERLLPSTEYRFEMPLSAA